MRFTTKIVRHGELLGPVDYTYDFATWVGGYGCTDERKAEMIATWKAQMQQIETGLKDGKEVRVRIHGDFSHQVIQAGMYDGWPYWRPTPAVLTDGTLGPEWHFYNDLSYVQIK